MIAIQGDLLWSVVLIDAVKMILITFLMVALGRAVSLRRSILLRTRGEVPISLDSDARGAEKLLRNLLEMVSGEAVRKKDLSKAYKEGRPKTMILGKLALVLVSLAVLVLDLLYLRLFTVYSASDPSNPVYATVSRRAMIKKVGKISRWKHSGDLALTIEYLSRQRSLYEPLPSRLPIQLDFTQNEFWRTDLADDSVYAEVVEGESESVRAEIVEEISEELFNMSMRTLTADYNTVGFKSEPREGEGFPCPLALIYKRNDDGSVNLCSPSWNFKTEDCEHLRGRECDLGCRHVRIKNIGRSDAEEDYFSRDLGVGRGLWYLLSAEQHSRRGRHWLAPSDLVKSAVMSEVYSSSREGERPFDERVDAIVVSEAAILVTAVLFMAAVAFMLAYVGVVRWCELISFADWGSSLLRGSAVKADCLDRWVTQDFLLTITSSDGGLFRGHLSVKTDRGVTVSGLGARDVGHPSQEG